jgi:hypothetical protein
VVVNDFDFAGIAISPHKTYPILIVDAQAPLLFPVALQLLQPIPRRLIEFLHSGNAMDLP